MIKLRSYFLFLFIILFIVAFKFYPFEDHAKPQVENTVPIDIPELNPLLEIYKTIEQYDSILSSEIIESGTVGAAIVITYKNQIAFQKCYGVKKTGEKDSINKNTIFRLASVSKTITGILAGMLSDEKIIDLDDKVIDYIPGFQLKDSSNTHNLTVRNILSHTSGLVPHAYDNLVEDHVPFRLIMNDLDKVDISAQPGILYGYQNVIFSLYDTIATINTSKKYADLLHEKIFTPFKMTNASTGFDNFKKSTNKALPHNGSNGKFKTLRLNNRYYSTTPAAGVNASIFDMSQLLLTLLNTESTAINNNVRDIVFTPEIISPLKSNYLRQWDNVDSKHYSIGWRLIGYKGRKVAYHGGYLQGYRAEIALCRDEDIGIAFLSNSPNNVGSKSVPTFLNLFFNLKDNNEI